MQSLWKYSYTVFVIKKLIIQTLFASTIRFLAYPIFVLAVRFPYVKVQIKPERSWA